MLYFIQGESTKLIKIGVTRDINRRLIDLQIGSPDKLIVIGVRDDFHAIEERILHLKLAEHCSHGEWFHPNSEVLVMMNDVLTRKITRLRKLPLPLGGVKNNLDRALNSVVQNLGY